MQNRKLSGPEIWLRDHPVASRVIGTLATLAVAAAILLVLRWDADRTYEVQMSWTTKEVVQVMDPKGRVVEVSDEELKKLTYDVVWVK